MKIAKEINKTVIGALRGGQILVYPTETSYGLGGDATNPEVVEKIYKIKQRREEKPFLVIVPDVEMAKEYLEWSPQLDKIAKKYWPGALTVVGQLKADSRKLSANGVMAPDKTIALRVIAHPIASALARGLGGPLISTSANISGQEPAYSSDEVFKIFEHQEFQPDILIDAGELPKNLPTTMVKLDSGQLIVLRKGQLEIKSLEIV